MNLNDKRIQAYTKTAQGAKDDTVGKVRTHMDELMKRDGLLKSAKPAGGAEKQMQNQARQNAQSGAASLAGSGSNGADSVYRRVAKFLLLIGVNEAAKMVGYNNLSHFSKIFRTKFNVLPTQLKKDIKFYYSD